MSDIQNQAMMAITMMAAYADGEKHKNENKEISEIAVNLANGEYMNLVQVNQDVLLGRANLPELITHLQTDEARQRAFEMAVGVCEADGAISAKEFEFLQSLKKHLNLGSTTQFESNADAVASAAVTAGTQSAFDAEIASIQIDQPAPAAQINALTTIDAALDEEINKQVIKASIINGALELLPESIATMAIIPLQMRMVYNIGQKFGYDLDKGHIKDLLATVGVGMTSQYLEQAGIKLLGGVLGSLGKNIFGKSVGKVMKGVGGQAISSGMSFATTYALGHVAKEYYASGRQFSTQVLKDTYARLMQQGVQLQSQYLPQIQQEARSLNMAKIMQMVKGQ